MSPLLPTEERSDRDRFAAPPLLEFDRVSAGYGPFRALFEVSFAISGGTVLALIGANGAGKTTVARVASGLVPVTSGAVRFEGLDITTLSPWRRARLGIAQAPEGRSVFGTLTVDENLLLEFRRSLGRRGTGAALERAYELFPQLGERRRQAAGTLSGGEQRMLALARVLVRPPQLLVVDELSLGLAPIIIDEVYELLGRIRDSGTTLLIIEQYIGHALRVADDVVLLRHGEVAVTGKPSELGDLGDRMLRSAHGRSEDDQEP